ncbi:MAG: hypothetical protein GX361_03800 [Bacteroidales bacterium]|nr:hypothetical protein [Bacteroidales bacterium]
MKEELTIKMHSELAISPRIEELHRCMTIWCHSGIKSENNQNFEKVCERYGVSKAVVLKNKKYCLSLIE